MNQSTVNFLFKALGVEEATREIEKISKAAKKASLDVPKYLKTSAGSQKLLALQTRAATAATNSQADATDRVEKATGRASKTQAGYFAHIARTTIQSALINKLFLEFVDVSGQAIKQVDLMQNFPATMASMGQSTKDASDSMNVLSKYIGQIGGNLGTATSMVTRFTGATKSVKAATAIFTGINNALIAGDSSADEQRLALIQFAQALERGKPDMREWMSLTQNMSFQLSQVAKEMGYVNADALGEALRNRTESMANFATSLTKLSTGTGDIAKQALVRMQGMEFAFNVLKNTMVQGLAAIINAFGRANIVSFFETSTRVVILLTGWLVTLMNTFVSLFNIISKLVGGPQLSRITGDAKDISDSIGSGADNAGALGDGLDDAGDSAKKLNKQLASFDKMNVLQEGKQDDDSGTSGFDVGAIGDLEGLFEGLQPKLQEITTGAKIFAGVLAAISSFWAVSKILKWFDTIVDGFYRGRKGAWDFKKEVDNINNPKITPDLVVDKNTWVDKLSTPFIVLGSKLPNIFGKLPGVILRSVSKLFGPIGLAIGLAIEGGILAFGFIEKNWETMVSGMKLVWQGFVDILSLMLEPAIKGLEKAWDGLSKTLKPAIDGLKIAFDVLLEAIKPFINEIVKFYDTHIKPIIDAIVQWAKENVTLGNTLEIIGGVIVFALLLPFALLAAAIAVVVIAFLSIVVAIMWVIATMIDFANYIISGKLYKDIASVIESIATIFTGLVGWIFENVIKPIGDFFVGLWNGLVETFQNIGTWFSEVFEAAVNGITDAWSSVVSWFGGVWEGIKDAFGSVGTWFRDTFSSAWEAVKKVFSTGGQIFVGIKDGILGTFKTVVNGIIGGLNTIIKIPFDGINTALRNIKNIEIAGFKPFEWLGTIPVPQIPKLARGAVVTQPTLAEIGENGAEAVVPLENNTEWINKLASKINGRGESNSNPDIIPVTNGQSSQPNNITINVSGVFATSPQEQQKIADLIAKQLNNTLRAKGLKGAY